MEDLLEFLRARLDEDEARVRGDEHDAWHTGSCGYGMFELYGDCGCDVPAQVLAEVDAKRRMLDLHASETGDDGERCCTVCGDINMHGGREGEWPCTTLRLMALPHASHPDYREEWRP